MDKVEESKSLKKSQPESEAPINNEKNATEKNDWAKEQLAKLKEFGGIALTLILDAGLVILITFLASVVENYILHSGLKQGDNYKVVFVYKLSQISAIALAVIYALVDLVRHIIKAVKALKNNV